MALTSNDETELLLPLFAGVHEGQRFATFLDRVRSRTQADYIGLFFRHATVRSNYRGIGYGGGNRR